MGFAVIQGYGLTETAPIVTLNHPFKTSKGSVGTPIAGVEVRIAEDGEILVRGENVTSGYYENPRSQVPSPKAQADPEPEPSPSSTPRLAAHRRHRRTRRAGTAVHQGPQEGNDRHARRAERLSRGRRARAERAARRARVGGRRRRRWRRGARARGAACSSPVRDADAIVRARQRAAAGSSAHSRARRSGPTGELPRTEGTRKLKRARDPRLGAVRRAAGRAPRQATRSKRSSRASRTAAT